MEKLSQGQKANLTGKVLEHQVINRVKEAGYIEIHSNKSLIKTNMFVTGGNFFSQHCYICKSIYNTDLYTDVILFNKEKFINKLAIEVKWQQCSGSIDEKLPFLIMNIKEKFPCPAIIIIDGGGYRHEALEWLKNQVDKKLIGVFSLTGFLRWANSGGV